MKYEKVYKAVTPTWQYGSEISKASGVGLGRLYHQLSRLEDAGLIESQAEPFSLHEGQLPRRKYRLAIKHHKAVTAEPSEVRRRHLHQLIDELTDEQLAEGYDGAVYYFKYLKRDEEAA